MTSSQCIISYLQKLINPSPSCLDHSLLTWREEALTISAAWWHVTRHSCHEMSRGGMRRPAEAEDTGEPEVCTRSRVETNWGWPVAAAVGLQHPPASPSHTGTPGHISYLLSSHRYLQCDVVIIGLTAMVMMSQLHRPLIWNNHCCLESDKCCNERREFIWVCV